MIILIDDDKYIRLGWTLKAKKMGVQLLTFESCELFLKECKGIAPLSNIYIDSNLERGFKGEIEAKKIFEAGFTKIYLCTGYSDLDISEYPWITKLVSKEFPLQVSYMPI